VLVLRPATVADLATLADFNQAMARETEARELPRATLEAGIAALLRDPTKGFYLLAERDGLVVGQLMITYEWSDWRNGWLWWVQGVYVRPEARRQGVFKALFNHVADAARADPEVIGLRLYVERENHRAHATYRNLGLEWTSYLLMERHPL
jgi:GNAT superfamily N-acetyltransferase